MSTSEEDLKRPMMLQWMEMSRHEGIATMFSTTSSARTARFRPVNGLQNSEACCMIFRWILMQVNPTRITPMKSRRFDANLLHKFYTTLVNKIWFRKLLKCVTV